MIRMDNTVTSGRDCAVVSPDGLTIRGIVTVDSFVVYGSQVDIYLREPIPAGTTEDDLLMSERKYWDEFAPRPVIVTRRFAISEDRSVLETMTR